MNLTVRELAERLGCPYEGNGGVEIGGVAGLEGAKAGDLVFLAHKKFLDALDRTRASAAIIPSGLSFDRLPVLRSANPHLTFVRAAEIYYRPSRPAPGIHPTAVVSATAKIAPDASIGAYAVIGEAVEIGSGAVLFPHVTVYPGVKIGAACVIHSGVQLRENITLGERVILHNGVVIGADGFAYLRAEDGSQIKIPQTGTVIIEDDVEIGANSTVDRAALDATIIRRGVKIDDLVIVSHNCEVGENTILVAQVGIAGSSKIGKGAILSGQVGIADHLTIGDGVIIAAKSGVTGNVPAGAFISGSPHLDIRVWRKFWAVAPQVYDMVKEVKKLRARVAELERK
jgi:UDP-3-O-[3-hydroxymyristoyl] glucosamine N-acyltransferase